MLQMNGRLLANVSNKEKEGVFTLIPHTLSISEIFQILLVKTNHENSGFSLFPNSDLIEFTEKCLTL